MSLALKWGETEEDSGFIYMDAVSTYTQNYTGQVTKHPVSKGYNITDAFIKNNPTFTFSAVITGVDISTQSFLITDPDDGSIPYNVGVAPSAVSVNSTDQSVLKQFIPDSIGQFLSDSTPDIRMDTQRQDLIEQIRQILIDLMDGVKYNEKTNKFESNILVVKLYEYTGTVIKRIVADLVITGITFREDANTGYALYCDIACEQVTFVDLERVNIPKAVAAPIKKKAASKQSLGKCDSTVKDTSKDPNSKVDESVKDVDPLRQGVANG